jgi:hypothetical protein
MSGLMRFQSQKYKSEKQKNGRISGHFLCHIDLDHYHLPAFIKQHSSHTGMHDKTQR